MCFSLLQCGGLCVLGTTARKKRRSPDMDRTSEWADVTAGGPVEPTLSASQVLSGQVTTVVGFSSVFL